MSFFFNLSNYFSGTGKMKTNFLLLVLAVSVIFPGCSIPHFYYSPNIQNVPLFKEKNEFSGLIAGSLGAVNTCLELQAGYSFPEHIALTANYMTGGNDNSTDYYKDFSKTSYFEGAMGYYKSFNDIGVFEIFGGYGQGSQHHTFTYSEYDGWFSWTRVPDGTADISFSKLFIQPDIGIKINGLEGAFSFRISNLNLSQVSIYNSVYHLQELNDLKQNHTSWLFEPAFTFRGGLKSVKGQIQLVFSRNITNPDLLFEICRINVGLYFNLQKKQPIKLAPDVPPISQP